MWMGPTLDYTRVHLKIRCFRDSCDNAIEHEYASDNWSARIDGKCSKCGSNYSVKVASLSESDIISRTKEEVYR